MDNIILLCKISKTKFQDLAFPPKQQSIISDSHPHKGLEFWKVDWKRSDQIEQLGKKTS